MRVGIIGAGNTGFAFAAYLQSKGIDYHLFTRDTEKKSYFEAHNIRSTGLFPGTYAIQVTDCLEVCISEKDLIIVTTQAHAHKELLPKVVALSDENTDILVINGNWAVYEYVFGGGTKTIFESGAQLFISSIKENVLDVKSMKNAISIASLEKQKTCAFVEKYQILFPQFFGVDNVIQTSMASTNPIIHVPIALFNLSRIEQKESFKFYALGATPKSVALIEALDDERIQVAKALGIDLVPILAGINSFFDIKHDNLYDALKQNKTYQSADGPGSFEHRYFTEDIPYGIYPVYQVAKALNMDVPITEGIIAYCRCFMPEHYFRCAPSLNRESIQKYFCPSST